MKLLKDIIYRSDIKAIHGSTNLAIKSIVFNASEATPQCAFVAIKGTQTDGHIFIPEAIEKGAAAIVCEAMPKDLKENISCIIVINARKALAQMACNFFDNPSEKIKLVGITGTNGKTTVATTLHNLYTKMGFQAGLLSTINNKIGNNTLQSTHTTADPVQLNSLIKQMLDARCTHCFMEVSSHAIEQSRVLGLQFDVAVFTNITHEHLNYHKTFDNYIKAKKTLFDRLNKSAIALYNKDDRNGKIMVQNSDAKPVSYSLHSASNYKAKVLENRIGSLFLQIDGAEVLTHFSGNFNAYNLLACYATSHVLGQDKMHILTTLSTLLPAEGRFQTIASSSGIMAIVDYAHTPDALHNVLETIKETPRGGGRIFTVIGCGGNRDASKRPVMAKIAITASDKVILTSDNPRNESPEAIINDMRNGLTPEMLVKTITNTDRKEAIRTACQLAEPDDVILIVGKGHEKYQEINGKKYPFDDVDIVRKTFNALKKLNK